MEIKLNSAGGTNKNKIFVILVSGASVVSSLLLAMLWLVPYYGFASMGSHASLIAGIFVVCLILLLWWASAGLIIAALTGKTVPFFSRIRGGTLRVVFPIIQLIGRLLGLSKQDIRSSFIKVNNDMVLKECGRYRPDQLLLLMPHCIQSSKCKLRLTYDIFNCKRCGKCPVAGLIKMAEHYGVHLAIATGGTLARRIVKQRRPSLIIATACERDLTSGIQDTYPLPVYGVLNQRPHGPCMDTLVALDQIEAALRRFMDLSFLDKIDNKG